MNEMYSLHSRTGKQCRERWHNYLKSLNNTSYWSSNEENILQTKHKEYGNSWALLTNYLPGRSENSIKNHFYCNVRKTLRRIIKLLHRKGFFLRNGIDYQLYPSKVLYKLLKQQGGHSLDDISEELISSIILQESRLNYPGGKDDEQIEKNSTGASSIEMEGKRENEGFFLIEKPLTNERIQLFETLEISRFQKDSSMFLFESCSSYDFDHGYQDFFFSFE